MKWVVTTVALAAVVASMTGCATPYMLDRGRDTADIFTFEFERGFGAKMRAGPIQTGLLLSQPLGGIRGGQDCEGSRGMFPTQWDAEYIVGGTERFARSGDKPDPQRGKDFEAGGNAPLWRQPLRASSTPASVPYYYSQVEVVAVALIGVRIGFNPGELVDFLLGWFGTDIFNDDLEAQKTKGKSNQVPVDTSRKLADPQH